MGTVITGLIIDWVGSTALPDKKELGRTSKDRTGYIQKHIKGPFDELVAQSIQEAGGWQVNELPAPVSLGDGWCCAIPDPSTAVCCALVMQQRLKDKPIKLTRNKNLQVRIGIHCAIALEELKSYIYGAGNYAARAQGRAEPRKIVVTENIRTLCKNDPIARVRFKSLAPVLGKKGDKQLDYFEVECLGRDQRKLVEEWDQAVKIQPVNLGVGSVVGDYKLSALQGKGKQGGEVWKAIKNEKIGKPTIVALKILRTDQFREDPDRQKEIFEWFCEEADHLKAVSGNHVVRYIDSGWYHPPGTNLCLPFLVMELWEGKQLEPAKTHSLRELKELVEVFCQICKGVKEIHNAGLWHLDLKPQNVSVKPNLGAAPIAKILDFGLSQAARKRGGKYPPRNATPYLAPEMLQGNGKIGSWSDVYSLGIMLFELLVGHIPNPHWKDLGKLEKNVGGGKFRRLHQFSGAYHDALKKFQPVLDDALRTSCTERIPTPNELERRILQANGMEVEAVSEDSLNSEDPRAIMPLRVLKKVQLRKIAKTVEGDWVDWLTTVKSDKEHYKTVGVLQIKFDEHRLKEGEIVLSALNYNQNGELVETIGASLQPVRKNFFKCKYDFYNILYHFEQSGTSEFAFTESKDNCLTQFSGTGKEVKTKYDHRFEGRRITLNEKQQLFNPDLRIRQNCLVQLWKEF